MIATDSQIKIDTSIEMQSQAMQRRRKPPLKSIARKCLLAACGVTERLSAESGLLLTFDDGPDPNVTPAVLDLLGRFGAKAVFFVVGNRIPKAPHLLRRILDEGHLIGNHTYYHPLHGVPSLREYYRDVQKCQAILEAHTGCRPSLFRPPLGSLTIASLLAPRMAGLRSVLWSIDVDDWKLRDHETAREVGERLARIAKPGDIVLLHDDNECVITVLEVALTRMRERHFDLESTTAELCS